MYWCMISVLPFKTIKFSLLALSTPQGMLNNRSTVAELGETVLYTMSKSTQASLLMRAQVPGDFHGGLDGPLLPDLYLIHDTTSILLVGLHLIHVMLPQSLKISISIIILRFNW